jgi:hypothetical protein
MTLGLAARPWAAAAGRDHPLRTSHDHDQQSQQVVVCTENLLHID